MAKKPKKLDIGKIARGMARERVGQPKSEQVVPDKRQKKLEEIRDREAREER